MAEHSYYVALYSMWLYDHVFDPEWTENNYVLRSDVLHAALIHDLEESFTSDIPNPIKNKAGIRNNADFKMWELEEVEARFDGLFFEPLSAVKKIVALADIMEGCAFLAEQLRMGNGEVEAIFRHMESILNLTLGSDYYRLAMVPFGRDVISEHINMCRLGCDKVTS